MRVARTLITSAALLAACGACWFPAAAIAADQPGYEAHAHTAAHHARVSMYVVRPGDTLSAVAVRRYGGRRNWPALWDVNRHKIRNPDMIVVGQRLSLRPEKLTARIVRRALGAIPQSAVRVVSAPAHHAAPVHHYSAPAPAPVSYASGSVWDCIAKYESGGNWSISTGNGYYGGLQFAESTWLGYGGGQYAQYANEAAPAQQIAIAERVRASQGWGAWPVTSARCGL